MWKFAILLLGHVEMSAASQTGNMNDGPGYLVSTSTNADPTAPQVFNTDYASKGHEYFDVWAPEMATHYGPYSSSCSGGVDIACGGAAESGARGVVCVRCVCMCTTWCICLI